MGECVVRWGDGLSGGGMGCQVGGGVLGEELGCGGEWVVRWGDELLGRGMRCQVGVWVGGG